jgi:Fe-S cluster assembly scaffold protein SufB
MTEVAEASSVAPARSRPARRGVGDLTYRLDPEAVERLAADEPGWLAEDRRAGLDAFERLPVESNQLYTSYVDLRAADLAGVVAYPGGVPNGTLEPTPPDGVAALAWFDEDRIAALAVEPDAARAGVTVVQLADLVRTEPDAARGLLLDVLPADDRLSQLSRAAWNRGVVIRVPAGVRLARPIVVRWSVGAPGTAVHARTIVELGEGAEASLVEEIVASDATTPGAQALFTSTSEVRLGKDARLAMASLQESGPDEVVFQQRLATLGEGADLRWALAQLGGRLVRSRVDNVLAGDRSTVEQVEIVFGAGEQLHDLTSYTRHLGRDTTGQLLSKGVLLDKARSYLKGLISIEKTAIGTDSYLGEFGMNLSKTARAVAIPSLEIDQPDCRRAAHASSVGPIDEGQLFYLETRGIELDEARKFIVLGFLEPVVARVPLEEAQDRLRDALEAKWSQGLARGTATAA